MSGNNPPKGSANGYNRGSNQRYGADNPNRQYRPGMRNNGNNMQRKPVPMKKGKSSLKTKIITAVSIIAGIVILAVMILNVPIITVERRKGSITYSEKVSIIRYLKELQPLAEIEGVLSADTNSYELISGADQIDDKREFTNDQIIEGQFTVLVMGFDESRELSDVMMLFLFDIHNKKLDILQIPRDSYVPNFTSDETGKLNSVYMCGDQNLIPIQRTVTAVREMFGIPIDRYITTGCDDIVEIVDAIGGIPIDLPEMVVYSYDGYGNPKKYLEAGEQILDGEDAELMVRARAGYDEGDIGRVKAQRIFMTACMRKAMDMSSSEMSSFLEKVLDEKLIATDMTLRELSILSDLGTLIDMEDVTVQMVPGEGAENEYGYSVWSIHKRATVDILNKYFRPYQVDLNYDVLPIIELVEEGNYLTDKYDENQDTLQEIASGAKPGENKKETTPNSYNSNVSDESYVDYYNESYDYEDDYVESYDSYSYDNNDYNEEITETVQPDVTDVVVEEVTEAIENVITDSTVVTEPFVQETVEIQ